MSSNNNNLNLDKYHQENVISFLKFSRFQRDYRLRSVSKCFQDVEETKLNDTTYTVDECTEILSDLKDEVVGEIEIELINSTHTNIVILRQLFLQAEERSFNLKTDISQLENRDLLDKIKQFEEGVCPMADTTNLKKIDSIHDAKTINLLKIQNEKLKSQNLLLETELNSLKTGKGAGFAQLGPNAESEVDSEIEIDSLNRQITALKLNQSLIENKQLTETSDDDLMNQLYEKQKELMQLKKMLQMSEQELEKKVSMTAPFKNIKLMLLQKNAKIKDLRRCLARYE